MQQKKEFFVDALHIFILFSFALAQPLFDLLSQNAEFFIARHSKPIDVILLILILCVLLPALMVLIEVVAGLFGRRSRKGVHYFMVAGLTAVIALPALNKLFEIPGTAILAGATILGIGVTTAYIRFHPVRMLLTVLSPALLLFPGLFLFNSPVFKVVFPEKDPSAITVKVDATAPVIMVVFDGFPVTSLMDEHRLIDSIRYPNFAALARDAYWFRNATTVAESTEEAVPAILSGSYPKDPSKIPTIADYPHNLFTFLGDSYEMKVYESHTMLCPETLCMKGQREFVQRMYSMFSDLFAVYLHIVLPMDLTSGLPVVTQTWKGFGVMTNVPANQKPDLKDVLDRALASYNDRPGLFVKFVESINISDKPTLYFLHVMLPHVPWQYFPSGKIYTKNGMEIPGLNIKKEKWDDNKWLVIQGYQRHLLQVGFVNKLLGMLITKLKVLNLYDRTLIIITADHGVNFWPNKQRRNVSRDNPMDILTVPLFIKKPYQYKGVIIDRNVETIDILPTIADILGVPLPWSVDGHSALDSSRPEQTKKIIYNYLHKKFVFDSTNKYQHAALERKLTLFSSGEKPDGLFKIGPHNELIGLHVSKIEVMENDEVMIQLDQTSLFANIDPETSFVPAHITGHLLKNEGEGFPPNLAIAVNGKIQAVTKTFDSEKNKARFSAIVPETAFQKGKNEVEVFVVSKDDGHLRLTRTEIDSEAFVSLDKSGRQEVSILPSREEPIPVSPLALKRLEGAYTLINSKKGSEIITSSDGKTIPVIPDALQGHLDTVDIGGGYVQVSGWAADIKNSQIPEAIMIFANGKFFYSGRCNLNRPDVAKAYGKSALKKSGFVYRFLVKIEETDILETRIFAVSKKGVASELNYPKGYKWGRKS